MLTRRRLQSLHGNASAHKRQRESFEKALREAKQEGGDTGTSSHDIVVKLLRSFNCEHTVLDHDPEWSSQKVCCCLRSHVKLVVSTDWSSSAILTVSRSASNATCAQMPCKRCPVA